jgi:hypothetical protein
VITGGSTGMALAGAKLFVEEGAHVFIQGRRPEALDDAVIPERAGSVKSELSRLCPFFGGSWAGCGRASPAVGVQAERPQRSEDERPGCRRGWRDAGRRREQRGIEGVWGYRVPSSCVPKISAGGAVGFGCRSSLRRSRRA